MPELSPPGRGRVRWGPVEEYYPAQPQAFRYEARHPSRRSTIERVELPTERHRIRNEVTGPYPRGSRDDAPIQMRTQRLQRRSRDEVPVQTYTEWDIPAGLPEKAPGGPDRQYTESPRPIENEDADDEDEGEGPRQKRSSYDKSEYSRRFRSRSRSPGYSRYESPRYERFRSRETTPHTAADSEWYSRHREWSFSSNEYDPYDKFDFSSQGQSITESSMAGDSDAESPESEERTILSKVEKAAHTRSQLTLVQSSIYTGNAEMGGSHTATLNVVHDPKGQKNPLFRWLHVPQDVMNFEDLWIEISRISDLTELEKKAIARLRGDVKKNCVKSRTNPKGAKVGYLDPRCIEVPLKSLKQETTTADTTTGSARWICIPYFSLEQYSGLLAATSMSLFPAQTLLQVQYSRNTAARDMEQAVVQLGNADRGECFHISQLWCLVIDDSLIVTCGTMTRDDLVGQALEIKEHPSRVLATERKGSILVAYGDSVVWSLATEECRTWFAFLSKFQAFWPRIVEFWHKDQAVTADTWPKILKLASNIRSGSLKLTMKLGFLPDPPARAVLRSEPQILPSTHGGKGKSKGHEFAHVLAAATEGLGGFHTQEAGLKALEVQLDAAERFLTCETTYSDRKAYKSCETATRSECYDYLAGLASRVEDDGSDIVRRTYEERVDIFNAVDIVYTFFLPLNFNGSMVGKFWGAVRTLIELSILDDPVLRPSYDNTASNIRTFTRDLTRNIMAFQNIVTHSSKEERAEVELPSEFSKAWLYLTMAIIYSAKDDPKWNSRMKRAEDLIEKGSKKFLQGLSEKSLLEKAAVLPLEVLSLVTMGLLQDQVGKSDDICDTYSQYLNSLDNAITSKPSDRSFQHQLDLVQQELVAVKRTLWKQKSLITRLRNTLTAIDTQDIVVSQFEHEMVIKDAEKQYSTKQYYAEALPPPPHSHRPDEDYTRIAPPTYVQEVQPANDYMGLDDEFLFDMATSSKLSPTDAGGLRGLFFLECSRLIEQREFEFRRFTEFSKDLERAIAYKMDFTRDRQERAIYAFTLVTIVFLPISTVSSIFGMNTTDVRDMNYSQWLYWVVAIPLTIVVILVGLWFMGELGNLTQWLLGRSAKGASGYGGPTIVPQTLEASYWAPSPIAQTTQVAEYSSPYEPEHSMRRRIQAQAYHPAQGRVYRSRTMDAGNYR
ncbi:Ff.00g096040.m01.CDS01 [Fusarium sp. VM40]|nr:Ff.00g096040.m01.CDS01 [Fusarium sp. VM40]